MSTNYQMMMVTLLRRQYLEYSAMSLEKVDGNTDSETQAQHLNLLVTKRSLNIEIVSAVGSWNMVGLPSRIDSSHIGHFLLHLQQYLFCVDMSVSSLRLDR